MESKNRWSLAISVSSLMVAGASLVVSGYFAKETQEVASQSKRIQEATLRPILVPSLEELSFDKNYIKIVLTLANRGPTTAVIKDARLTVYEEAAVSSFVHGLVGAIISPGNNRRHVYKIRRNTEVQVTGGAYPLRFDPYETLSKMGRLPFIVSYESQQLPGVPFADELVFTSLPWHDKSIIGVGD